MISDEALREAAQVFERALLSSLPEPEDCSARFSPAFERRMKRLILRVDHPVRFWLFWAMLALALAGGIAGGVLLTRSRPAPGPAPGPVSLPAETSQAPAEPEPAAVCYRPTWLPEGCEWDRESLYEEEGMIVYRLSGGGQATFLYDTAGGAAEDAAPEGSREVAVDSSPALLCLGQTKGELNELFWSDGETAFWLSAPFPEEDMLRVAESVEARPLEEQS